MGCGCSGGNKKAALRKQGKAVVGPIAAANINVNPPKQLTPAEKVIQERRIIETRRRENILKALRRP